MNLFFMCLLVILPLTKIYVTFVIKGFPDSSVGKESACNAGDSVQFLGQEDPLEKG